MPGSSVLAVAVMLFSARFVVGQVPAGAPVVGQKARPFLSTPGGQPMSLASLTDKGPVALIVLRGYPGYSVPLLCTAGARSCRKRGEVCGGMPHMRPRIHRHF
jgi:hypothetical protein